MHVDGNRFGARAIAINQNQLACACAQGDRHRSRSPNCTYADDSTFMVCSIERCPQALTLIKASSE
jgi:hypothetical protein